MIGQFFHLKANVSFLSGIEQIALPTHGGVNHRLLIVNDLCVGFCSWDLPPCGPQQLGVPVQACEDNVLVFVFTENAKAFWVRATHTVPPTDSFQPVSRWFEFFKSGLADPDRQRLANTCNFREFSSLDLHFRIRCTSQFLFCVSNPSHFVVFFLQGCCP